MNEEHISIEQLFEEELFAVEEMAAALRDTVRDWDSFDAEYYEIRSEIAKLEMTAEYLKDRLADEVPCKWLK